MAGLVKRRRSDRDARAIAQPTGKGTVSKILAARAELLEPVLAGTREADKKAIGGLLKSALAKLTDNRDRAWSICRFCEEGVCRPSGCPVEQAVLRTES